MLICDAKSINTQQLDDKTPFEFDEIIPNRYGQRGFGGTWISGNEFTLTTGGNFIKYDIATQTNVTILSSAYIASKTWSGPSFRFSSDLSRILVRYSQRQIFRHSTVSKFSVLKVDNLDAAEVKISGGDEIQIAFFSPTGNDLAYIKDNNIYYMDLDAGTLPEQVTADGEPGIIYNGIPDWVYEEEVLGTDAASWFSPNGQKLAFVKFDDTNVREAVYDVYGEGVYPGDQYPKEIHLRYPKVCKSNKNFLK